MFALCSLLNCMEMSGRCHLYQSSKIMVTCEPPSNIHLSFKDLLFSFSTFIDVFFPFTCVAQKPVRNIKLRKCELGVKQTECNVTSSRSSLWCERKMFKVT